jgi:hypothetical protein
MAKPKTLIMAEQKARMAAKGIKKVAFWLTEAEKAAVKKYIEEMKK